MGMPNPKERPQTSPSQISNLIFDFEKTDIETLKVEYPWADRFVMGLPLPSWQRDFKWDEDRCIKFIESIWNGFDVGAYMVTRAEDITGRANGGIEFREFNNMVLDGQQRLTALEMYLTNKFAVNDEDGNPVYWKDVERRDRLRFERTIFPKSTVPVTDEFKLRSLYDMRNFGGVVHEDHERALSDEFLASTKSKFRP